MGSARAPAGHDDGDGGGRAARRRGHAPVGGRPLARDWRGRIRRLPRRAARVGADVAGGCAPRHSRRDAGGMAFAVGDGGRCIRDAGDAAGVSRRAERRDAGGRRPASGRRAVHGDAGPGAGDGAAAPGSRDGGPGLVAPGAGSQRGTRRGERGASVRPHTDGSEARGRGPRPPSCRPEDRVAVRSGRRALPPGGRADRRGTCRGRRRRRRGRRGRGRLAGHGER